MKQRGCEMSKLIELAHFGECRQNCKARKKSLLIKQYGYPYTKVKGCLSVPKDLANRLTYMVLLYSVASYFGKCRQNCQAKKISFNQIL